MKEEHENQQESLKEEYELSQETQTCEEEFEALKAENADLKDKYMRANAEFENIKKRLEKEKVSALAYANENFAKDLLDVLDALEAAANMEAADDAL